jgi:archaemetzincin
MSISLWWVGMGPEDEDLLEGVQAQVERQFVRPVVRWTSEERPAGTLDIARGQHSSRELLRWLVAERPSGTDRVLGVTDVDLFIPILTFVFGEAQLDGPAAVVSTMRLRQGADRTTARARLAKESVHELGHTFGLVHCDSVTCVMARSASVRSVDAKSAELCPVCRERYQMFQQDGLHVYREHENPRRR